MKRIFRLTLGKSTFILIRDDFILAHLIFLLEFLAYQGLHLLLGEGIILCVFRTFNAVLSEGGILNVFASRQINQSIRYFICRVLDFNFNIFISLDLFIQQLL